MHCRSALAALLLLSLSGCELISPFTSAASDSEATSEAEGAVRLQPGETADLAGARLRFDQRMSESRCPMDGEIMCAWAGMATIEVTLTPAGRPAATFTLDIIGPSKPVEVDTLGYRLGLVQLTPFPSSEGPPDVEDVIATLQVVRR